MGLSATHPPTGIGFTAPAAWCVAVSEPDIVVAVETARSSVQPQAVVPFRANLVLTVADNGDLSFGQWQRASDDVLPLILESYELVDVQKVPVAGHPGGRRLARHLDSAGELLVMQQWFTAWGRLGVTLTATCDAGSYRLLLPEIRAAASSLALPSPATSGGAMAHHSARSGRGVPPGRA